MALNKKQTSTTAKVLIIVLALAFVGLAIVPAVESIINAGGFSSTSQTGTGASTLTTRQITAQATPTIEAQSKLLQKTPKDYNLLVQLGNSYFDYAASLQQAAPTTGQDKPIWAKAASQYRKALALKPGDPNVSTDYAIATYNADDTTGAMTIIEKVIKADPKFAPARFNAGIFYGGAGQTAKAIASLNTYLQLEPRGTFAQNAKDMLVQLKK